MRNFTQRLPLAPLLLAATASLAQKPTPVPSLDLNAFTGTWYEAARLPDKPQKNCIGVPIVLIALGDKPGQLQIVDSCTNKAGYTDVQNQTAKLAGLKKHSPPNAVTDGKLKLASFIPLFSSPLWVLSLDRDAAVVGSPNHKKLWILSRTPAIDPAALSNLEAKAAAEGYATTRLIVAK